MSVPPKRIPASVCTADYQRESLAPDLAADLAVRLAELHPAAPGTPSADVSMSAINYLCGHAVRWGTPGTRLANYMPQTVLYTNPAPVSLDEDDRLLMTGLVKFRAEPVINRRITGRIMALPEIRVVLGNGYTLVFRPMVDRDVSIGDDPACFASLVKTPPGDIADAVRCPEYGTYDIKVHGVPAHHHMPHAILFLDFGAKSVQINVKPDIFKRFNPDARYTFVTARILEKLFPVLRA